VQTLNPNQQSKGAKAPTLQSKEKQSKTSKTNKAATLLAESVTKLMNSNEYKKALTFRKKLHTYSFRNVWLIYCQNPEATLVAGYSKWKELGRQVKKGEKSLAILAPLIKKDRDTKEKEVFGFRSANVFDIEQTEGPELPELPKPILLTKDNQQIQAAIKTLESFAKQRGNPVSYKDINANGLYSLQSKAITINKTLPPLQTLKTLTHELAHALMHANISTSKTTKEHTHTLELEAESCAYLVCDSLGLDTSHYSFAYLANWAEDPKELLTAAEKACKAADTILEALEPLINPAKSVETEILMAA